VEPDGAHRSGAASKSAAFDDFSNSARRSDAASRSATLFRDSGGLNIDAIRQQLVARLASIALRLVTEPNRICDFNAPDGDSFLFGFRRQTGSPRSSRTARSIH